MITKHSDRAELHCDRCMANANTRDFTLDQMQDAGWISPINIASQLDLCPDCAKAFYKEDLTGTCSGGEGEWG